MSDSTLSDLSLTDDGLCFGCGPRNPVGLNLTFAWDGDACVTRWMPLPEHQGWAGRVHGGLLALVLDEVLSRAALERHGLHWVTAELTTRLKRPAPIGRLLRAQARIVAVRPRLIVCEGDIQTEDGLVIAAGRAKLMRAQRRHYGYTNHNRLGNAFGSRRPAGSRPRPARNARRGPGPAGRARGRHAGRRHRRPCRPNRSGVAARGRAGVERLADPD